MVLLTRGEYRTLDNQFGLILYNTKTESELILVKDGNVWSSYKTCETGNFSFGNKQAKEVWQIINVGIKSCTAKNGVAAPFVKGTVSRHTFQKNKLEYVLERYNGEIAGAEIIGEGTYIYLEYYEDESIRPLNIPYIKLTEAVTNEFSGGITFEESIPVRTLQEISLEKDLSWLKNKKYYIVNDTKIAEQIFTYLENYKGPISYDTETTGLRINMFGKVNSKWQKQLEEYNAKCENPDDRIRVDKLVGFIFSIEPNVAYYFPVANRKFKNLYEDVNDEVRKATIQRIKEAKRKADPDCKTDMGRLLRDTPDEQLTPDVIAMERIRPILEKCHIVAHNGTFEWKVGWMYEIDTNLCDDTMIMHQLMYKFRSTTSNRGEPSNLKYLEKREFGIDSLELSDFFLGYEEDDSGKVRNKKGKKKKGIRIDFSYMDYEGARAYAPADGDWTLQLFFKYKRDLIENHNDLLTLYGVEIIVACAVGYMEFYGHRLDEQKIEEVKNKTIEKMREIEKKIAELAGLGPEVDVNKVLSSPAQVAKLFFETMQIPFSGDKPSVAKKVIKPLLQMKNEDGSNKYPVVHLYSDWKKLDTLLTKFFDNLQYYMYPGGFIFSSYGQISTATGRMSCSKPNAQQYPKDVTGIVIPRDGYIMIGSDYSQIEYRTLVALAGEMGLLEQFKDPDMDYHTMMASLMYGVPYASVTPKMRSDAKSFNFGIPYGMGFKSLAILLTGMCGPAQIEEAKVKYELYFKDQPNVRKFFDDVKEMALVNKYTKTAWNRKRYYSFTGKDGNVSHARKASALRKAGNAVIQGCLGGDTRIQTKEFGMVKIKDVVGKHLLVWDGEGWSHGDITYSGKKQKCIVTFSNGQQIICSPTHKFLVVSHRGNKRFVECKDLSTKQNSTNPHRVIINQKYVTSDFKYSSTDAYKYYSYSNNSHNVLLEDIKDSFERGVVLGRLASDGSIQNRDIGGSYILNCVAESEENILPELERYMAPLGVKYSYAVRTDRNEDTHRLFVYSKSLVFEVESLDIKHRIHDKIFMDTEMLRGFLRGLFDGDGGISGKTITLVIGKKNGSIELCHDIQKALLFFGIRSRCREHANRYVVAIKTNDNQKFLDTIGFINENKQKAGYELKCIRDEHVFGPSLVVESVEITDEYIDMYDVCNTAGGYYVADGIITHNTAADIFKIAVARCFTYIRRNGLIGLLHITNMVHDELLFEASCEKLNIQRVIRDIAEQMQFQVEGFPPLYIGAGVGLSWKSAKGKEAEIHPHLCEQLSREADNMSLFVEQPIDPKEVLNYFNNRVFEFRKNKIIAYLMNPENYGKDLHPVIGNLLNLQFTFGLESELGGDELTRAALAKFIEVYGLGVDPNNFKATVTNTATIEEEEEEGYEDEDEEELEESEYAEYDFNLIDEGDTLYGVSLHDIISTFGFIVSQERRICGIDIRALSFKKKEELIDYIAKHKCEPTEAGAMQLIFLKENNVLFETGVWVKDISGPVLAKKLKLSAAKS